MESMDEIIYLWDVEHTCIAHGALTQDESGEYRCLQCEAEAPRCVVCGGAILYIMLDGVTAFRCKDCGKEMEEE